MIVNATDGRLVFTQIRQCSQPILQYFKFWRCPPPLSFPTLPLTILAAFLPLCAFSGSEAPAPEALPSSHPTRSPTPSLHLCPCLYVFTPRPRPPSSVPPILGSGQPRCAILLYIHPPCPGRVVTRSTVLSLSSSPLVLHAIPYCLKWQDYPVVVPRTRRAFSGRGRVGRHFPNLFVTSLRQALVCPPVLLDALMATSLCSRTHGGTQTFGNAALAPTRR